MIAREFSQLRCPFCFEPFVALTHAGMFPHAKKTRFGVVRCCCDQFPIIEGVLVLRRGQEVVIDEIKRAYTEKRTPDETIFLQELSELRLVPRRVFVILIRIIRALTQFSKPTRIKYQLWWWKFGLWVLSKSTTNQFLRAVFSYFKDRDKRPTYVLISSLLVSLRSAKVIVEVGGGAGHLVRDLMQTGWQGKLYSLEKNFWLTYWIACCELWSQQVLPIVADVEAMLPFSNNIADVVLANDTFMYVDHQRKLAQEITRVMKPTGWFAGMHIHTQGATNVANGCGVHPHRLATWLQLPYQVVIDDRKLFNQLWQKGQNWVTLSKNTPDHLPKIGSSFSLLAARRPRKIPLSNMCSFARNQLNYLEDQW